MWFLFALLALLCWSFSDLFSKLGSPQNDKYSHIKMVFFVGTVMGAHAIYGILSGGIKVGLSDIISYLPVSLLYIGSMTVGYLGLRYIELSISSPVCNSSGAVTVILLFCVMGQRPELLSGIGIIAVCLGVVLLGVFEYTESDEARIARQESAKIKYTKSLKAILIPIIYCILDALGTFFDGVILDSENTFLPHIFRYLEEEKANTAYELTFLFMAIVCALFLLIKKEKFISIKYEGCKAVTGVFETVGQFFYVFALSDNSIAAAPVISAYCAVSALWSHLFLKEKLSKKMYFSLILVLLGIVILGIAEGLEA